MIKMLIFGVNCHFQQHNIVSITSMALYICLNRKLADQVRCGYRSFKPFYIKIGILDLEMTLNTIL